MSPGSAATEHCASLSAQQNTIRVRLLLKGAVQGVGLRPALVRAARRRQLAGWVKNLSGAVEVELQGAPQRVNDFLASFREELPVAVLLESVEHVRIATQTGEIAFEVLESEQRGESTPPLIPDRVICEACWRELTTPGDRRHGYALNSCADCGPRYAMTRSAPYDRARTSLCEFPLCADCQAEYSNVDDRRFHTEGIACPNCGPQLRWLPVASRGAPNGNEQSPIAAAVEALRAGQVVALKGVSGYQLLVDATNHSAVERLRARKHRPTKPFALLFRDLEQLQRYATLSRTEIDALTSPDGPIVLCTARTPQADVVSLSPAVCALPSSEGSAWAGAVRPWLGALLPTSGIHRLLATEYGAPLVCTSANRSGEPLCSDLEQLEGALPGVFDGVLDHSRRIVRRLDDSVVHVSGSGSLRVVRRGRGLVPHPIQIRSPETATSASMPVVLALGGQLKTAVCWLGGQYAELSEHLGDLHSAASLRAYEAVVEELLERRGVPDVIACDAHPDYASSRVAEALAARLSRPLLAVPHHRAHIAAVTAEHVAHGRCLAFAWDGLGLGEDGTLWGGEVFLFRGAKGPSAARRVASLRPFSLLGGEQALREPRRVAKGLLLQAQLTHAPLDAEFQAGERRVLEQLSQLTPKNCSSVGRLFDAVASLLGVCQRNTYEAHAASWLELCARSASTPLPLRLHWSKQADFWTLDWVPLLQDLCAALANGVDVSRLALGFHHALADAVCEISKNFRTDTIVLSGGCFQNSLLLELVSTRAKTLGMNCICSSAVPAGDGGLALGQAVLARALVRKQSLEQDPICV
ncbi:MAG: carbamoyltransferase HypF [Myxococcales bacterium]|nr:carbamoyltransferase HypF [Myxococcales bacterium]